MTTPAKQTSPPHGKAAEEEDDDDYMNMTFGEEPKTAPETSLQRRQRLKREGEIRGHVKSKAEQAAAEKAEREEVLSRSLLDSGRARKSKGFAMMAKMGFKGGALGSKDSGTTGAAAGGGDDGSKVWMRLEEPIRPEMKEDRGGIGIDSERKRKLNEAAAHHEKKQKVGEDEFRERVRRERELDRKEKQFYAGMKVCERMDEEKMEKQGEVSDEEEDGDGGENNDNVEEEGEEDDDAQEARMRGRRNRRSINISKRPLKSIPVIWRGLVRSREEAERDRRMRHDLEQSSAPRLPTYAEDLEDADDKTAMGKAGATCYAAADDLEEEDPELEAFGALEADERLRRLVEYLRREHNYCFWCKCGYPDERMDGCPGLTEEDHD
ncbi:hypothetical protein AAE478_000847 [Parahypoxylon ruwenzoriense]